MSSLTIAQSETQPVIQPETHSLNIESRNTSQNVSPEAMQQRLQLLGSITWLMFHSPLYRAYSIETLESQILPSLAHNQFRYYEIEGQPVGFLNWCWLTDEIATRFQTGDYRLSPQEWIGGNQLWFPEFIAPFGHTKYMVKDIRQNIFTKGTPAKALRINADGTLRSIAQYKL